MRKKLISLISVCAMLATMTVGLVNTAYAFDDYDGIVSAVYNAEDSTDTSKVVEIYYDKEEDGISAFQADIAADDANAVVSISMPEAPVNPTWEQGNLQYMNTDGGSDFTNKKLVIITITVPENTAAFNLTISNIQIMDGADDFGEVDDIVVAIPASTVTPVDPEISVSGADTPFVAAYTDETVNVESVADIFKVLVEANNYDNGQITDLNVNVNGVDKSTGTELAAGANVTIAVIIGYKGAASLSYTPTITAVVE